MTDRALTNIVFWGAVAIMTATFAYQKWVGNLDWNWWGVTFFVWIIPVVNALRFAAQRIGGACK